MKLLFLGCSWTFGCELAEGRRAIQTIIDKRYSTIIGKKLNAEVINLAENAFLDLVPIFTNKFFIKSLPYHLYELLRILLYILVFFVSRLIDNP